MLINQIAGPPSNPLRKLCTSPAGTVHLVHLLCGAFPNGPVVKDPPANTADTGSIPGPGRAPHASGQPSPSATTAEPVL